METGDMETGYKENLKIKENLKFFNLWSQAVEIGQFEQ